MRHRGVSRPLAPGEAVDTLTSGGSELLTLAAGDPASSVRPAELSLVAVGWPEAGVDLRVFLGPGSADGSFRALRDGTLAGVRALADRACLRLSTPLIVGFPRVSPPSLRPPRPSAWWRPGLLHATDKRLVDSPEPSLGRQARRVVDATPPQGVTRHCFGTIVLDEWHVDPNDLVSLERTLARQAEWYATLLGLPPEAGWNELGDEQVSPSGFASAPAPLAWYEPRDKRGLLPIVPDVDGGLPIEPLAEVLRWVADRRLPDGRELDRVDLVFPRREDAVRLRPAAKARGVARTLYVADGDLWNIHPLRRWYSPD